MNAIKKLALVRVKRQKNLKRSRRNVEKKWEFAFLGMSDVEADLPPDFWETGNFRLDQKGENGHNEFRT